MNRDTWALFCEISLWFWIVASVGFIINAFPSRDSFRKGSAAVWGAGILVFYACWIVGMMNA